MKYFFIIIILSILAFCLFTFPIFNLTASDFYLLCNDDFLADKLLSKSIKWQTDDYFVYKLDESEVTKASFIPNGKIIKEYIFAGDNTFKCNPLMQSTFSGGQSIVGKPYIID